MGEDAEHSSLANELLAAARDSLNRDPRESLRNAEHALTEFSLAGDFEGQIHAYHAIAWAACHMSNWPTGIEAITNALNLCHQARLLRLQPLCVLQVGLYAMEAGLSTFAVELCQLATNLAIEAGDRLIEMRSYTNRACALDDLGRCEEARELNEKGIAMCEEFGGRDRWAVLFANRCIFRSNDICHAFDSGDIAHVNKFKQVAMAEIDEAIQLTRRVGNLTSLLGALVAKVELLRVLGSFNEMPPILDDCLTVAQTLDMATVWSKFYMVSAMYERCCDRHFAGACLLEQSCQILQRESVWRLAYQTHIEAANAFEACGRATKAEEHRNLAAVADRHRQGEATNLEHQFSALLSNLGIRLPEAA